MENMQKAVIMAGSVFMFIIAISVAIFSYTTVTNVIETVMTASEYNDRTAEYFIEDTLDTTRSATRAEVITTILSMKDIDYSPQRVYVNGVWFEKKDYEDVEDTDQLEKNIENYIEEGNYSVSYDFYILPEDPDSFKVDAYYTKVESM